MNRPTLACALFASVVLATATAAYAADKGPPPRKKARPEAPAAAARPDVAKGAGPRGKSEPKAKVLTFTGLDVEGKLKTPQLLYFLNRVKTELDTTAPEKRSFMKELEASAEDPAL